MKTTVNIRATVLASTILFALFLIYSTPVFSQQDYYDVTQGAGYGIRFWNTSNNFKIHMGNTSEYLYGPVSTYSIKMNMSTNSGRGWTWGCPDSIPIAALGNTGHMKIAGNFTANRFYAEKTIETNVYSGTKFQLATHSYGKAHAIFFSAYKNENATGSLGADGNSFFASNPGSYANGAASIIYYGNGGSMGFYISDESSGVDQPISWGSPVLWLQRDGNVGIGQSNPSHKLTVAGAIRATEVRVDAQWWDSVFEADYPLTPLSEVETFIKENHHLPELPTEAEVEQNGAELGSTVSLLLKKIEELTLYTIEQQKQLDAQAKKLEEFQLLLPATPTGK